MLDEVKDTVKAFLYLRFPASVIGLMGAFSFGLGLFYGDVVLTNRKLVLGVFLLSVAAAWYYVSDLFPLKAFDNVPFYKKYGFRVSWVVPAAMFLYMAWKSGHWLWTLMSMGQP